MALPTEYEGRNVEKAVQAASQALDIDAEQLKYDVLSYGSSGIFGLVGAKKARIRVLTPKEKQSRIDNGGDKLDKEAPPKKKRSSETSFRPPIDDFVRDDEVTSGDVHSETAEAQARQADEPPPTPETPKPDKLDLAPADNGESTETMAWSESEARGREALQRIVDSITQDAQVISRRGDNVIEYDIKGGQTAVIIGKRGQTLEAIQYLVVKIVNKQSDDRIRVHIDAGDYMLKRRQSLEQIASRVAAKAKRMGRPASLGQLNPHDRRIVHMALRDDEGVLTKSLGAGHLRKLVIYPKKRANG